MKTKSLFILLILLAAGVSAFSQGFRFDATIVQQGTVASATNVVLIPANAIVKFCNFPASGAPCNNLATTYTSQTLVTPCSTSTQIVLTGTSSCVASPDAQENWGVWVPAGIYSYTVTLPGGVNLGPFTVTLFPPSANYTFTGNNTHSGIETFTGPVTTQAFNDILWVGAGGYATCAAAATAAGSTNKTIIAIRSSYAGAACPSVTSNITIWDFTGGNPSQLNTCVWNTVDVSGLHAFLRCTQTVTSPASTEVAGYFVNIIKGTLPANQTLDGGSSEIDILGALTNSPSGLTIQGYEASADIFSTGQTLSEIRGLLAYGQLQAGATTNVITSKSLIADSCRNNSGGGATFTNCYGLVAERQLAGTTLNYSLWSKGATLQENGFTWDVKDAASGIHKVLDFRGNNNIVMHPLVDGAVGWEWDRDDAAATYLLINATDNVKVPSKMFSCLAGCTVAGGLIPSAAAGTDVGSTALPFGNLWLGTAATNNFKLQPAATAGARIVTMTDPVSPATVGLPFTIASGTSTLTSNATLAAVTSQAAITTAGTGILVTDTIEWSYATAPTAGDSLCHVSPYVTAGNVNFVRTNPTAAAQNVSALVINWRVIR